jgi:hypothetical protein
MIEANNGSYNVLFDAKMQHHDSNHNNKPINGLICNNQNLSHSRPSEYILYIDIIEYIYCSLSLPALFWLSSYVASYH